MQWEHEDVFKKTTANTSGSGEYTWEDVRAKDKVVFYDNDNIVSVKNSSNSNSCRSRISSWDFSSDSSADEELATGFSNQGDVAKSYDL